MLTYETFGPAMLFAFSSKTNWGKRRRWTLYMMQGCHTPPPPPTPWYPLRPPCGVGPVVVPFPAPPVVSLLWWAEPLALFAVVPAAGGTAHDVVLQTATRVDNRIIFDIMLNIIIVVVIFIISTIKEQLPPSPSPYNPHD